MPVRSSGTERNNMKKMPFTEPSVSIRTVPQTQPSPSPPSGAGMRFAAANSMGVASYRLAPPTTTSPPPHTAS